MYIIIVNINYLENIWVDVNLSLQNLFSIYLVFSRI